MPSSWVIRFVALVTIIRYALGLEFISYTELSQRLEFVGLIHLTDTYNNDSELPL